MIKIGLFGVGHLGKIHLSCLSETDFKLVGFYDPNVEIAEKVAIEYRVKSFDSPEELIAQCDAVDIVSPTITHFELAKVAMKAGKHVFLEKPVTEKIAEAEELVSIQEENDLIVQVGHVERFNPAFRTISQKRLDPLYIEGQRLSVFNPRGTDVSVVLDLMIHDIDLVLSIVRSPIKEVRANGASIVSSGYDICNARLEFENGCIANLTASRVSLHNLRKMMVFEKNAYASIDFMDKKTQIMRFKEFKGSDADTIEEGAIIVDTPFGKKEISVESPQVEPSNAIKEELKEFYRCIMHHQRPLVSLTDGLKALKLAHQIEEIVNKSYALS
jgi:predicted dehydrogenase